MLDDELVGLEEQGWRALSSTPQAAEEFYDDVLDHDIVMLLPGGVVIRDRTVAIRSMSAQPWSSFLLEDLRTRRPTQDTGLVTYAAVASRADGQEYSALMSSVYVHREDGWKLAFHQQTPR